MPILGRSINSSSVSFYDVILVTLFAMFTIFVTYSWEDRLSTVFASIAIFAIAIYIISAATGILSSNLDLKRPTWTIGGLIGIPTWILINLIPSSTNNLSFDTEAPLIRLFGVKFFINSTQSYIIPVYESFLLVALLVGIFMQFTGTPKSIKIFGSRRKANPLVAILFFIGGIGALMHYVVALELAGESFSFNYVMLHQFISFYIFAVAYSVFKLPGTISMHIVKNLLLYGSIPLMIFTFIIFIILDILGSKNSRSYRPALIRSAYQL